MKKRILFAALFVALVGGLASSSSAKMAKPAEPVACADGGSCTVDGGTYSYQGIYLK